MIGTPTLGAQSLSLAVNSAGTISVSTTYAAANVSNRELEILARAFSPSLSQADLYALLAHLNAQTDHRFTGVYRFEPGWVVSVALFDREAPDVRFGPDVKMKESYCWLCGVESGYVIEDARTDPRLTGHPARDDVRSYVSVPLLDKKESPWGSLCHYDFFPRPASEESLAHLRFFRPLIEEMFVRESVAHWDPDASPSERMTRTMTIERGPRFRSA